MAEYLRAFPCVGIVGARQSGKTTLLKQLPPDWKTYDLERQSDRNAVALDPDLFLRLNPERVAVDEAQLLPELFAALRVAIDQDRERLGRFVITGSSSPGLLRSISESLAGRIGIIELAPFSHAEVAGAVGAPFFSLLEGRATAADFVGQLKPLGSPRQAHDYWFRGGYPEPWLRNSDRFSRLWMDQYTRTYLERDVARLFPGLDQNKYRLFLQLLSGVSGTVVNYSDVARSLGVTHPTARDYFEIAHGTFLWRRVSAYEKNAMRRIVKHPKGFMRDSGLLHHLLRVPDLDALLGHPKMGQSWEGMVIEEVIRGLQSRGCSFDYFYYRTGAGAEVDLVLEGDFGLIPVEVKYGQSVAARDLRPLADFVRERQCRLGLVINNDERPRLYAENIVGVPFTCL